MAVTLFERQMAMYTTFHRDRRNRLTHVFGIPAIILSLLVALAPARVGLGPATLSLALIVTLAAWALWITLDRPIGLAMGVFMIPALAVAEWIAATQPASMVWIVFAVLFVGGWALQLWGHVYEGRRPALLSNLFQALIGPMFLMTELFFALGLKHDLRHRVERHIAATWPDYAAPDAGHPAE